MKDKEFQELLSSVKYAGEYIKGRKKPSRVFKYSKEDVKKIRKNLGLSQAEFARAFHINLRTLQNWEQARCVPEGPAQLLLKVAEQNPKALLEAINS